MTHSAEIPSPTAASLPDPDRVWDIKPDRAIQASRNLADDPYPHLVGAIAAWLDLADSERSIPAMQALAGDSELHDLMQRWAGVSPAYFQQVLSRRYRQAQLATALDWRRRDRAPASPPPPFPVQIRAMTPPHGRSRPDIPHDSSIQYGAYRSPFGWALVGLTAQGVCTCQFVAETQPDPAALADLLRSQGVQADLHYDPQAATVAGDRLFGQANSPPAADVLILQVWGTPFQQQVWQALMQIPPGQVTTYQQLAAAIGRPQAARAVGHAVGRNPIAYAIPCHRVIRASGELGGYRWGRDRKAAILGWEASQYPSA